MGEARHAATAWRTISWASQQDPSIRNNLRARYAALREHGEGLRPADFNEPNERAQFGLLDDEAVRRVHGHAQSMMDDVAERAFNGALNDRDIYTLPAEIAQ